MLSESALRMTGTINPFGVCAAMPNWVRACRTISPRAVWTDEFSSGYCANAAMVSRARSAIRLILSESGSDLLISARAANSSVASTSTQVVASGISRRLVDSLSATTLRSPLIGILWSVACDVSVSGPKFAPASTSARVMTPPAPDPEIVARSILLSEASLRTIGEITRTDGAALRRRLGASSLVP